MAPVGERYSARALRPADRRRAHQLRDDPGAFGVGEDRGTFHDQRIDARMRREKFFLKAPDRAEPVIPDLQSPVAREHAECLEQIVERRRAHAQQRVPRTRELYLLGPILKNQQQPAVGQGMSDHAQVRAPSQRPAFLDRFGRRLKPLAPLGLPSRKIAHFWQAFAFAHPFENAIEFRPIGQPFATHGKHPLERFIAETERTVGGELCDPSGQAIEHRALRLGEPLDPAACLFELVNVDREPCHAPWRRGQRHVVNAQHLARAADRRWCIGNRRPIGVTRAPGIGERPAGPRSLDQFDPTQNHVARVLPFDCVDISRIDHRQPQVGAAIPHRQRCGFDQAAKRTERVGQLRGLAEQFADPRLALRGVEEPYHHATVDPGFARRAMPLHGQGARRTLWTDRQHERFARFLRRRYGVPKHRGVFARQPRAGRNEIGEKTRRRRQAEPVRQPVGQFEPPVAAHHHRQRRGGRQQRGKLVVANSRRARCSPGPQPRIKDPARADDRHRESRADQAECRIRHHLRSAFHAGLNQLRSG